MEIQNKKLDAQKTIKKDRIFILVLAIVVAGIFYQTVSIAAYIVSNQVWTSFLYWALLLGNLLAVYATMYLMNNYRKRMKLARLENEQMIQIMINGLGDSTASREDAIRILRNLGLM